MASILVIDDDARIRANLLEFLEMEKHEVSGFGSGEEALESLKTNVPDMIFCDLRLPGIDGLQLLEHVKDSYEGVEVVIVTGYAEVATAVKAIKLGARDYVKKPFDLEEIGLIVQKAVAAKKMDSHLAYLQSEERERLGFGEIIGSSKAMKAVFDFVRQVSDSPRTTVLIRGDTGTGKELVARAIHQYSERKNKPFIEVNCSAFQETLLEAELFGYEAGAFTGARQRKIGLVELSNEGSFFLDEIGDMDLGLQSKVLKVIEEQEFRRVGGTKQIAVDTRIISATSRNLEEYIQNGKFREDLYYRLNVASIDLPPLRERGEDIILLAEHFLHAYNTEFKRNVQGIANDVKEALRNHSWPGNVRELKNVIERAVLFEKSEQLSWDSVRLFAGAHSRQKAEKPQAITPDTIVIPDEGLDFDDLERALLEKSLEKAKGNRTKAAALLGISREKMKYRLRKFKLS